MTHGVETTIKFRLYRVYVNSQGYDAFGSYWGVGAPIYMYESECGRGGSLRARSRDEAKTIVRSRQPRVECKFYN